MERFEDITAEMRAFKNHPNAKKSVSGSFLAGLLYGLANRLDAARKRECEPVGIADSLGNAAAMREALCEIVLLILKVGRTIGADVACGIIASKAKHALSAPARNCDRYDNKTSSETAFVEETGADDSSPHYWQMFANWLFWNNDRKGDGDGSK